MLLKSFDLMDHVLIELSLVVAIFLGYVLNHIAICFQSVMCMSMLILIKDLIHDDAALFRF